MIYEYLCRNCNNEMEREVASMAKMKKRVKCNKCGKMAPRKMSIRSGIVRHRLGEPRIGRGRGY